MNWCNLSFFSRNSIAVAICLTATLCACKPEKITAKKGYFDLKGFFRSDSARLSNKNLLIEKVVTHNGQAETKQVRIADWGAELSLFSQSDINKPAWQSSYNVQQTDSLLLYKAKFPELRTREIIIKKEHGNVRWIMIYNHDKNLLYDTKEELSYFPDSLYLIQRRQSVRILGANSYQVKGVFN